MRLRLGLLGLVIAAALLLLLQGALSSLSREDALRQEAAANTVFDTVDRALARRVEAEQARPFLHWSYHFVPDNDANTVGLSRSPLASLPEAPVLGYFQITPDGDVQTPYRAADGQTSNPVDEVEVLQARLDGLVRSLAPMGPPRDRVARAPRPEPSRKAPAVQMQQIQQSQLGNFQSNRFPTPSNEEWPLNQWMGPPGTEPGAQAQAAPPAPPTASEPVDVGVSPFEVSAVGDALVLHRAITVAGQTWVQGVAFDRDGLLAAATSEIPDDLRAHTDVRWGGGSEARTLRPPFDRVALSVHVQPLAGALSPAWLWALAGGAFAVLALAGALADRWIREATALAQQRADFVAAVSHELRTPLTSIRMYAEMLEAGMVPEPTRATYHTTIRTEAERLGRLVEDVLAFARLERGQAGSGAPGTLGDAMQAAVRAITPVAADAGCALTAELDDGIAATPVSDQDALVQVVTNLLDNAIKFAPGPIGLIVREEPEGAVLTVRDHGPGVDPAFLAAMFEPFVRGEAELTRRTRGTGIGLALVAGLVGDLGGRVSARNAPNGGLEVRVVLPRTG